MQRLARIAGVFYLMDVAFGPALYAIRKFVVFGDAAQTATNILAHETLFRLGFAGNLVAIATYVVVTALFYQLFKPVNGTGSAREPPSSISAAVVFAPASSTSAHATAAPAAPFWLSGAFFILPHCPPAQPCNNRRRSRSCSSSCMLRASTPVSYSSDAIAS